MAITDLAAPGLCRTDRPVPHRSQTPAATANWRSWGTVASVTVDDPAALNVARRIVARQFAAAERAAARFRADAELHRLYRAGGDPVTISPLLAELVAAALAVAERTDGDVDPTVGAAVTALGADRHREHGGLPVCGSLPTGGHPAPGWERVRLVGRRLQVPAGTTLDLSATAKAAICDMAAARVRDRIDAGVLVRLGGNAASAGPAPDQGWRVPVEDPDAALSTEIYLGAGAALATSRSERPTSSSTHSPARFLVDPHTGQSPAPVWRTVSTVGFTCLEAATYAMAALVRGTTARAWLTQLWVPARLVTVHGDEIQSGNWAAHTRPLEPVRPF